MKITNFGSVPTGVGGGAGSGGGGGGTGGVVGGDLGGTLPGPTVTGLQTVPVSPTAPTDGQVLTYVAADGAWEPKPIPPAARIWRPLMARGSAAVEIAGAGPLWWPVVDGFGNAVMVLG